MRSTTTPTILACDDCNQEFFFVDLEVPVYYVVPNFGRFSHHGQKAWCYSCQTVVDAERRMVASQIQAEIEALKHLGRARTTVDRLKDFGKGDREITRSIRERLALVQIAKFRESMPRCLQCFKTTILPLRTEANGRVPGVLHECGGRLFSRLIDEDSVHVHWGRIEYMLTPEGRPISTAVEEEILDSLPDFPLPQRAYT